MKLNSQSPLSDPMLNDEICKYFNKKLTKKKQVKSIQVNPLSTILGLWDRDNLIKKSWSLISNQTQYWMMKLRKKNSNIKENENKTESIRLTSQTCGLGHEMRITQ
jgi:hypothetical protein